jgi:hypothetical protein
MSISMISTAEKRKKIDQIKRNHLTSLKKTKSRTAFDLSQFVSKEYADLDGLVGSAEKFF